jgi:hypothetical protein
LEVKTKEQRVRLNTFTLGGNGALWKRALFPNDKGTLTLIDHNPNASKEVEKALPSGFVLRPVLKKMEATSRVCINIHFLSDSNEISPSTLLRNNIKVKEKFYVVLVHSHHKCCIA